MQRSGSLINMLMDDAAPTAPEVGMGCTILGWTDRHAATVVEVSKTGSWILVQRDKATRTDGLGMSDCQSYEYERDPDGAIEKFTRRRDGAYRVPGSSGGARCLLGVREEYFDYSF